MCVYIYIYIYIYILRWLPSQGRGDLLGHEPLLDGDRQPGHGAELADEHGVRRAGEGHLAGITITITTATLCVYVQEARVI